MKNLILFLIVSAIIGLGVPTASAENATAADRNADRSLMLLKEGNLRFAKGTSVYPNQTSHQRKLLAIKGQQPFASIICSSDSRVEPVLVFDRGLGDLFVIRSAGNVAGSDTLASVEYSMLALETPLLVVMGQTKSTIIKAAVEKMAIKGHMMQLMGKLEPAIRMTGILYPSLKGDEFVDRVSETNVRQVMRDILGQCPAVLEKVRSGQARVIGAVYDTDSGTVRWLGP
ncbi:carbonic anhydrase [Maridesulfovibrio sp.]|uniref:carbonic anhydrase n=1 Tax=Maridesulfovibrio sp. TaxID=2795000 RepID=UPI002A1872EF|nr:carbonic anhydrase [Maridesulfovibrio sp.]